MFDFAEWARQVQAMEPGQFWLFLTVLAVASAGGLYAGFRFFFRLRLIEDTPTSLIRSAAQGYVELEGHGELIPGPPIVAPLTGLPCLWYRYKVEERVESADSRGGTQSRWRTVNSGTSDDLFRLVDGTGECVVDPEGAEVTASAKDQWYGESASWGGGRPASRGFALAFTGGRYRYTEQRLLVGTPLYVLGLFRSVGGSQELPNTREEVRALLALWKRDPEAMARFDSDGDGQVDLQEWEAARAAAHEEVRNSQRQRMNVPATNLVSSPPDASQPFLISVVSQADLVRRMRWFTFGGSTAFLLCGAVATWMFSVR